MPAAPPAYNKPSSQQVGGTTGLQVDGGEWVVLPKAAGFGEFFLGTNGSGKQILWLWCLEYECSHKRRRGLKQIQIKIDFSWVGIQISHIWHINIPRTVLRKYVSSSFSSKHASRGSDMTPGSRRDLGRTLRSPQDAQRRSRRDTWKFELPSAIEVCIRQVYLRSYKKPRRNGRIWCQDVKRLLLDWSWEVL